MVAMAAIRRGGRDLRLMLFLVCAVAAVFGAVVSRAAAAQYTVVDLGPQGTEAGPTFEGAVIGISPSGLQVATNCGRGSSARTCMARRTPPSTPGVVRSGP